MSEIVVTVHVFQEILCPKSLRSTLENQGGVPGILPGKIEELMLK